MTIEVPLLLEPMEAKPVAELPAGEGWLLEPKYDGFRCILFRDTDTTHLQSRRQKPLQRFFPEVAAAAQALPRCVLDGELIIEGQPFDMLQARLHPAATRIAKLSKEAPAQFVAFDLLADEAGRSLLAQPFAQRRAGLAALFARLGPHATFRLSMATQAGATQAGATQAGATQTGATQAGGDTQVWLQALGHGLDGIVAKRLDLPYRPGERVMQKYKLWRTVDCVLGGLYLRADGTIEYLLLGLYDERGRLDYVGRCSWHGEDAPLLALADPAAAGFTGARIPGGKSRWSGKERTPVLLRPERAVEVSADHIENGRFRHGSRILRWRDDKDPARCTTDQLERPPGTPTA